MKLIIFFTYYSIPFIVATIVYKLANDNMLAAFFGLMAGTALSIVFKNHVDEREYQHKMNERYASAHTGEHTHKKW